MPLILALESSSRRCSAALGDGHWQIERIADRPREHHALLLPMVAALLQESGEERQAIDAIAFGRGPGSFTGLRIATAFAQGLGFALDRPLLAVSSLDALALSAHRSADAPEEASDILVAVDAHMGELFLAGYRREGACALTLFGDRLARVEGFALPAGMDPATTLLAGDAWSVYPAIRPPGGWLVEDAWPRASAVLELALAMPPGCGVAARDAEPCYVRGVSVWKTRAQQTGHAGR